MRGRAPDDQYGRAREISRDLAEGLSYRQVAAGLGRDPSLVSREVARHGGREAYRAGAADAAARSARWRPQAMTVERYPRLRSIVLGLLRRGWSPASIAGRLPRDHPHDQSLRVSHEAIYQWVYATPVSSLARELIALRTRRSQRRGGARPGPVPRIREPSYIDERPAGPPAGRRAVARCPRARRRGGG